MHGLGKKYKGSTLIEVLVATIIILICAGMGMTAFSNLGRDMNGNSESIADIYLNKILNDTKAENDYTDRTYEYQSIRFERTVIAYKEEKRLRILQVQAYNNQNRKIGEIRELILITP